MGILKDLLIIVYMLYNISIINVVNGQVLACYSDTGNSTPCECNLDNARPSVLCRNKGLTEVVIGIPNSLILLDLASNKIKKIEEDDFIGLEKLETLFLMDNGLKDIHPESFRNLYNLKLLVLDGNELTSISDRLFQHLPNLSEIRLQRNKIQIIHQHAFITLRQRVTIQLHDNPIQCDCNIKALKKWMTDNPNRLKLDNARCSNTQRRLPIKDTPDSEFPPCPDLEDVIPSNASCFTCQAVVNHEQCRRQGRAINCPGTGKVCSSRMTITNGQFTINKGCLWYQSCLNQERANVRNCGLYNKPDRQCNFCCVGDKCNSGDMGGRTKEFTFTLEMTMNKTFDPNLLNSSSSTFNRLRNQVTEALKSTFVILSGGLTSDITGFSEPQTTVSAKIYSTNLNTQTEEGVLANLERTLTDSAESQSLFSLLEIIPSSIIVQSFSGVFCPKEILRIPEGTFIWPKTLTGRTVRLPCPYVETKMVTRVCSLKSNKEPVWSDADMSICSINTSLADELQNLLDTPITQENVQGVLNSLKSLTSSKDGLTKAQLSLAVSVIGNILKEETSYANIEVMNDTVAVVSQLLVTKDDVLMEAEKEFNTSSRILDSVETIGNKISLVDGNAEIVQPNVILAALPVSSTNFSGITITANAQVRDGSLTSLELNEQNDHHTSNETGSEQVSKSKEDGENESEFEHEDEDEDESEDGIRHTTIYQSTEVDDSALEDESKEDSSSEDNELRSNKFTLPKSLFSKLTAEEKSDLERITFHVFPTNSLFSSLNEDKVKVSSNLFTTQINSGVISASVPKVKIVNLDEPVQMSFAHSSKNSTNPRCVYWVDDGITKGWSSKGCQVLTNVKGSYTTCQCNHLTNFALLMDVYQDGYRISEKDQKILSIITYIGCTLSFICLLLTIITYIFFKKLRKDNPSKILVNLCIALAIANLVFIIGMHSYAMDNDAGCKIVAVLLHYFLLAALSWMGVEAFYMYLALVLVFKTYFSKFMLKCSIVGWGIPLVIVIITLSINNTNNYAKLDSGICWLLPYPFYGAFAAPVLIVLLINFVAFGLVLRQLCGLQAKKLTKSDRSDKLSKVRGAIGVVILLGLTWIFAIFAIGPVQTLFSYLFAIFNALQGMFIFVFYCLFKKDAINSWKRKLPCCGEVVDEKSSSRGYSGSAPTTNSRSKTVSTTSGIVNKRVSSKYELANGEGIGDNNVTIDNNNTPNSTYI